MNTTQEPVDKLWIGMAMKKFGGGFASSLGEAFLRADPVNERRIREAFPDMMEEYSSEFFVKSVKEDYYGRPSE